MRAFADSRFVRVIVVFAAQNGKTALALNGGLARVDDDPAKLLYIGPTRDQATKVIFPKVDEAIRHCGSLSSRADYGQHYTTTKIPIAGVSIRLAWAGSTTQLAADDACIVIVDELDRMARNIKGEGSAVDIADARHGSYVDGKTIVISTPTEGALEVVADPRTGIEHWARADRDALGSQVWEIWQDGTRHEAAIPCQHCGGYFVPRLRLLVYPDDATPAAARALARLACQHCGAEHDDAGVRWGLRRCVFLAPGQRAELVAEDAPDYDAERPIVVEDLTVDPPVRTAVEPGEYVAPALLETSDLSLWSSGILSFSRKNTIGALAEALCKARRSGQDERVRSIVNTKFGECYAVEGGRKAWSEVGARRWAYRHGQRPADIGDRPVLATLGGDVGDRYIAYVIRAWVPGLESWLLDYGELVGDTSKPDVWRQLGALVRQPVCEIPIARACIDSGYRPAEVYRFQRSQPDLVIATKGAAKALRPFWMSRIDVDIEGKRVRDGQELWLFSSDQLKQWVHSRLSWPDGEPGAWHIPSDASEEYMRQIVGEYRTPAGAWVRTGANHYLDCEALAYLAIRSLGAIDGDGSQPPPTGADGPPTAGPSPAAPSAPAAPALPEIVSNGVRI